jgi:hypothetical protein
MPPHSSHVLQPLDVVCFSPLKRKYSQRVRDLARRRVFHINKEGFLPAFRDAFFDVFAETNCRKAFEASGLVPINAQVVLDRLEVRLRTPPATPTGDTMAIKDTKQYARVRISVRASKELLHPVAYHSSGRLLPAREGRRTDATPKRTSDCSERQA